MHAVGERRGGRDVEDTARAHPSGADNGVAAVDVKIDRLTGFAGALQLDRAAVYRLPNQGRDHRGVRSDIDGESR